MLHKFIALTLIALTSSCSELEYSGSTKILFEGTIANENGEPLPGIRICTYVSKSGDEDVISYTTSDENGHYRMFFPSPRNEKNVALLINQTEPHTTANTALSAITVQNIDLDLIKEYTVDFGNYKIFNPENAVTLTIQFVYTSELGEPPHQVQVDGIISDDHINYNPKPEDDDYFYDGNQATYHVAKNQDITVKYVQDGVKHEVTIPVSQSDLTYTIEY